MNFTYDDKLAQVNGIAIASKVPAGKMPVKARQRNPKTSKARTKECCLCGSLFVEDRHVRLHFVNCVEKNGNPNGARWHDKLDLELDDKLLTGQR